MTEVPLTQGKVALIDDEDAERVMQYKWSLKISKGALGVTYYARRVRRLGRGRQEEILLHRFILSAPSDQEVDHKDRDGLNNLRRNLRLATRRQNSCNRLSKPNVTGFRGTYTSRSKSSPFVARIRIGNRKVHLGQFKSAEEAARAYDAAAREHQGEFAILNFPEWDAEVFVKAGEQFDEEVAV